MTTYREFEVTPSNIGGHEGGKVHRLYDASPAVEEIRELRRDGWKAVDLTTGSYAGTSLLVEALKISATGRGLVFVR